MRITCPNCGAQYEIDPRVIPDIGRDVQCSNCGHTWFQRQQSAVAASVRRVVEDPPVTPAEPESAETDPAPPPSTRVAQAFPPIANDPDLDDGSDEPADDDTQTVEPDDQALPPIPSRPWAEPVPDPVAETDGTERDWDTREPAESGLQDDTAPLNEADNSRDGSAQLDDQMLAVLREEADREARARAAEARPGVEVQSDLGLHDEGGVRPQQRTADLHAGETDQDDSSSSAVAAAMAAAASRRQNLPDVDSITSSLRTATPASEDDGDLDSDGDAPPARSAFRTGFLLTLLLVIVAMLVYRYAPALADAVPSLRAPLVGYVEAINGLRAWIDSLLSGATAQLNSLSG